MNEFKITNRNFLSAAKHTSKLNQIPWASSLWLRILIHHVPLFFRWSVWPYYSITKNGLASERFSDVSLLLWRIGITAILSRLPDVFLTLLSDFFPSPLGEWCLRFHLKVNGLQLITVFCVHRTIIARFSFSHYHCHGHSF